MAEATNSRLEAFCDGVFAIALTLLIIDIKIPQSENIRTSNDLWQSLGHLLPTFFAFLLSFCIILITWVNHHNTLRLINRSSHRFVYSNGFMLLTIVFIPFPTALFGDNLFTGHAAPAVVLYSAVNGLMAIGWLLICSAALSGNTLAKNERAAMTIRSNYKKSWYALATYSLCTLAAFWFPVTVAVLISLIWIVWLIVGISIKNE